MEHVHTVRVRFGETDAMGIAHHASHLLWIEAARYELLRHLGFSAEDWTRAGVAMPVADVQVRYRGAARFDDVLQVRTCLEEAGRRKLVFRYTILKGDAVVAEASSIHVITGPDGRPAPLPVEMASVLARGSAGA